MQLAGSHAGTLLLELPGLAETPASSLAGGFTGSVFHPAPPGGTVPEGPSDPGRQWPLSVLLGPHLPPSSWISQSRVLCWGREKG